jgi:diacylglycerol kinase family enzyme
VDHPAAVVARGARVTLSGPEKMALQLDGDAAGLQDRVDITLLCQGYEVIVPSPSGSASSA